MKNTETNSVNDLCVKTVDTDKSVENVIEKNKKYFACDICGKKFCQKRLLKKHSHTHTRVKPYSCHECGKGFSQRRNLNRHYQTHTNEKPYSCDYPARRRSSTFRTERPSFDQIIKTPLLLKIPSASWPKVIADWRCTPELSSLRTDPALARDRLCASERWNAMSEPELPAMYL
ncbi:hypothetical protein AVEN_89422-1 [Araneus ventricosus]|uniref:C2H2-type domain-containing protein n=1 Tax=Araneus ventricosus TaxID=182803 RepID=A0A4Y2LW03_ARAVE|nr:hypothetical protein AVEN_89422-1 [Araneus ventricosus]